MAQESVLVHKADLSKVPKDTKAALEQTREKIAAAGPNIDRLTLSNLLQLIPNLILRAQMLNALATHAVWGNEAADFLKEYRDIIRYYHHRLLGRQDVRALDLDSPESEFYPDPEMYRNIGHYWLRVFQISPTRTSLRHSSESFNKAFTGSPHNTVTRELTFLEYYAVESQRRRYADFDRLSSAYHQLSTLTLRSGDWIRFAEGSWLFKHCAEKFNNLLAEESARGAFENFKNTCAAHGADWQEFKSTGLAIPSTRLLKRLTYTGHSNEFNLPDRSTKQ